MTSPLECLVTEWNNLKGLWLKYTLAQALLNGAVIAAETGEVLNAGEDVATNVPFFASVNLVYAKCVDYIARTCGRYGRIGATAFSLGVSGAFYTYASITNDADPLVPSVVAGSVGLVLTNHQVSKIHAEDS